MLRLPPTLLYAGLALLYCWPILIGIGSRLPSDAGDPALNAWILWWNSQAVPLTSTWWNAPIHFPLQGAFAFSETLLGLLPVSLPLLLAGLPPVAVYNIIFLISIPASALAAHALAKRLTGRDDAALLAGLAFGFSPYRLGQMSHLQLLVACWMPLGLWALHSWLDQRRFADFPVSFERARSVTAAFRSLGIIDYGRASTHISARHADAEETRLLRLAPGAILLVSESVDADPDGRPIQYALSRFPADRLELIV